MPNHLSRWMCIATTAAALAGCIVVPAHPYRGYGPVVAVPPPPPQVEYVGPPPVVGQIWIGGFWGWRDGRHQWQPGHWEAPRQGQRWVPHQWEREGNGWRFNEGHWDRH